MSSDDFITQAEAARLRVVRLEMFTLTAPIGAEPVRWQDVAPAGSTNKGVVCCWTYSAPAPFCAARNARLRNRSGTGQP